MHDLDKGQKLSLLSKDSEFSGAKKHFSQVIFNWV